MMNLLWYISTKNASFVEGNYRDKLVIVLHSLIDNYLKTLLIQVKPHKCA